MFFSFTSLLTCFFCQQPDENRFGKGAQNVLVVGNLPHHHHHISDGILHLCTNFNDAAIMSDQLLRWNRKSCVPDVHCLISIQPREDEDCAGSFGSDHLAQAEHNHLLACSHPLDADPVGDGEGDDEGGVGEDRQHVAQQAQQQALVEDFLRLIRLSGVLHVNKVRIVFALLVIRERRVVANPIVTNRPVRSGQRLILLPHHSFEPLVFLMQSQSSILPQVVPSFIYPRDKIIYNLPVMTK